MWVSMEDELYLVLDRPAKYSRKYSSLVDSMVLFSDHSHSLMAWSYQYWLGCMDGLDDMDDSRVDTWSYEVSVMFHSAIELTVVR